MKFLSTFLISVFILLGFSKVNFGNYSINNQNNEFRAPETITASDGEQVNYDSDIVPINSDVGVEFISRTEDTVTIAFNNIATESSFETTVSNLKQANTAFALVSDQTIIQFNFNPALWADLTTASYLSFSDDGRTVDATIVLQNEYSDELLYFYTGNNETISRYVYDITSETELTNVRFLFGFSNITDTNDLYIDGDDADMFTTFITDEVISIPTYSDFINPPEPPIDPPKPPVVEDDSATNIILGILVSIILLMLTILLFVSWRRKS